MVLESRCDWASCRWKRAGELLAGFGIGVPRRRHDGTLRGYRSRKPGYTFTATATDQGEPGRHRDTFSLVIKDARGTIVARVSGDLDGGNIQSTQGRPPRAAWAR